MTEHPKKYSDLFYRNLIANSLDGMLITDEKGMIKFASTSATTILGFDAEALTGKSSFIYVHPDDREYAAEAFMNEVTETPRVKFISVRLLKQSSDWVWCIVRGHNLLKTPEVKGMVIYFYDDTLRKNAENALIESEKLFRSLIYNLKQGVILQNEKTEIILCNPAAKQMLGLTEEEIIGKRSADSQWDVIHEDGSSFPSHLRPIATVLKTKNAVRDVVMGLYRQASKGRIWILVNADPILDKHKNVTAVISSFMDITQQKWLSQELIEQEIQKQKQLTQATIDGQEKERLEIGKELHDNISQHLTTTRLYLEVAREKAEGELLEMVSLAHKGLADIINEIRQLSQSLVPPTLGDLGLAESVQDLCDSLKRTHTFKIDFNHRYFEEMDLAENIKLMLFRVIQEQINNIVRHSGANTFAIRLQSDSHYVLLSISDNGKGFDPVNYKKGLGLTNIANRVGLFNGKVTIDTALGKGCTISVTIPRPRAN